MGYIHTVNITGDQSYLIEPKLFATAGGTKFALTAGITNFTLMNGAYVHIKVGEVGANATLNVNNTGAIDIYYNGTQINADTLTENNIYTFIYDGLHWNILGDITAGHTHSYAGSSTAGGAANSANKLNQTTATALNTFTDTSALIYTSADSSNNLGDKPTGVDAFGLLSFKTANGYYGQLLMSSNTASGLYWRTATTLSGGWNKILDSNNYTDYTVTTTGIGASGTWEISITGSAGEVAWDNVSSKPTKLTLTGAVTGEVDLEAGNLNLTTTVNHNHNASYLTTVGYDGTNKKIYYTKNGSNTDIVTVATLRTDMGLSNALHFIGITSTTLSDGATTSTLVAKVANPSSLSKTTGFVDGDVVMDGDQLREYVWSGGAWILLGFTASAVYSQTTTGNSWIASITQGTDGAITATTRTLDTSGPWTGNANTATSWSTPQNVYVDLEQSGTDGTLNGGQNTVQILKVDGILPIGNGGTGTNTAPTQWGIIYASSTSAYACTTAGPEGEVLIGHGANSAPSWYSGLTLSGDGTTAPYLAEFEQKVVIQEALGVGSMPNASVALLKVGGTILIGHEETAVAYLEVQENTTTIDNDSITEYILNFKPNVDTKGNIGLSNKRWNSGYFSNLFKVGDDNNGITLNHVGQLIVETTNTSVSPAVIRTISLDTVTNSLSTVSIDNFINLYASKVRGTINIKDIIELDGSNDANNKIGKMTITTVEPTIVLATTTYKNPNNTNLGYNEAWSITNTEGVYTLSNDATVPTYLNGTNNGWNLYGMIGINTESEARPTNNTIDPHSLVVNGSVLIKNSIGDAVHLDADIKSTTIQEENQEPITTEYPYINFYPASNLKGSLGLPEITDGGARRWANLYLGTSDTYGDSYTPVYWNDGVPEAVAVIQREDFVLYGKNDSNNSITAGIAQIGNITNIGSDTQVVEIVVESGISYLQSEIEWSIQTTGSGNTLNRYIKLQATIDATGDNNTNHSVSGYILFIKINI